MSHVRFDPSKAVTFDLSHGLVHLDGAPPRLLVPAEALGTLAEAAGADATRAFGRALGEAIGLRVASRLSAGDGLRGASVDAVIEHLGGELSISGLGALGLERWGRALVLVIDQSPLAQAGDALLEALLGSALEAASRQSALALFLDRDATRSRFLIAGNAGVEKVRAWLAEGVSWGEALVRLHASAGSSGPRSAPAAATSAPVTPAVRAGTPAAKEEGHGSALTAATLAELPSGPRGDA